jgi:hypothetical protein
MLVSGAEIQTQPRVPILDVSALLDTMDLAAMTSSVQDEVNTAQLARQMDVSLQAAKSYCDEAKRLRAEGLPAGVDVKLH